MKIGTSCLNPGPRDIASLLTAAQEGALGACCRDTSGQTPKCMLPVQRADLFLESRGLAGGSSL